MKMLGLGLLLLSSNVFAIRNDVLVDRCWNTAKAKIAYQADTFDCAVDLDKVEVYQMDNRWYSPTKSIWFEIKTDCLNHERLTTFVQYRNGECF